MRECKSESDSVSVYTFMPENLQLEQLSYAFLELGN